VKRWRLHCASLLLGLVALFYAVALAESGKRVGALAIHRPWPWTLNIDGQGHFYPSRKAATDALFAALDAGQRSVDIGLMQISWRYHRDRLGGPAQALDPYHNLRVAAQILNACYHSRLSWGAAAGCYHAPADPLRAARYQGRVLRILRRLATEG
jgi:hypothetical protein